MACAQLYRTYNKVCPFLNEYFNECKMVNSQLVCSIGNIYRQFHRSFLEHHHVLSSS